MDGMTQFRITYDGSALATHEMDARELAPALLAMADLLDASVRALHGDKAKAQINVKGSFKTGSFNIDFNTAVSYLTAIKDIFAGDGMTAAANAAAVLGILGFAARKSGKGLGYVLKWLRGRRITHVRLDDNGTATIQVDEDSLQIEQQVLTLLRDLSVREAFDRVLAPLDQPGVDLFAAGNDEEFSLVVTEKERVFFAPPAGVDELLLEERRKMAFSIVALTFKEDNKWRLSDGNSTINAKISDSDFIAGVNSNEIAFSKGDVLICDVLVTQWQTEAGAKTDYEVIQVIEHKRAARQISLPGIDPPRGGTAKP
ncbi:hypothetical protein XCY_001840 [Xanthomonas arboricola pv. juglandis]|uniref:hypothetical protein n=1 Tax=Xanthomonas arboricola TaxID=56448 RepID=UPI001AF6244C|nr:hypothetical protein [Xanthomonas arboricola]CAG2089113.1 hypothetical protein XCY_001840 [Xanthomonas arboricola pv. juglandis]